MALRNHGLGSFRVAWRTNASNFYNNQGSTKELIPGIIKRLETRLALIKNKLRKHDL